MNDGLIGIAGTPITNPRKRIVRATSQAMNAGTPSVSYAISPPVNPAKTEVRFLGFSSSGSGDDVRVELATDGSALTFYRENATAIASNNVKASAELTEFY